MIFLLTCLFLIHYGHAYVPPFNLARGSNVALVTPFDSYGKIDFNDFSNLVNWQIEKGTKGIVILGTTGEGNTLSRNEKIDLIKLAKKTINNRVPLIVGTGHMIPKHTVESTLDAMELGADGVLIVTPYYCKPSQNSLINYYTEISEEIKTYSNKNEIDPIPIILYNVPSRTGVELSIDTIKELSKNNLIAGLKEANSDCNRLKEIRKNVDSDFLIYSGDDKSSFKSALQGSDGVISVTANILPTFMYRLMNYGINSQTKSKKWMEFKSFCEENNFDDIHDLMFLESNPIPVKWALYQLDIIKTPNLRKPLNILDEKYHSLMNKRLFDLKNKI